MSEITNKQQPQHLSRLVHVAKGTRYYDLQFEDGTGRGSAGHSADAAALFGTNP